MRIPNWSTLKQERDLNVYPKAKFRMKITTLEKQETENGPAYKVLNSEWVKGNAKELRESIKAELAEGKNRTIELVDEEPKKFKVNQIYMLKTRDVVWIYKEQ